MRSSLFPFGKGDCVTVPSGHWTFEVVGLMSSGVVKLKRAGVWER